MYTTADIPAFREQILANSEVIWKNAKGVSWTGVAPRYQVVLSTVREGTQFAASVVDVTNLELYLTADVDENPAMAVFKLLTKTAERLTQELATMTAKEFTPAANLVAAAEKEKA